MQGELIERTIYEGSIAYVHGMGHRVRSLIVDGMVITIDNGRVHAYLGDVGGDADGGRTAIATVDVPDHIVDMAHVVVLAHQILDSEMSALEEIMQQRA